MPTATQTASKPVTLSAIARDMLMQADGDMNRAAAAFASFGEADASARGEMLFYAARKLLAEVPQVQRAAILSERAATITEPFLKAPERMQNAAKAARERLVLAKGALQSSLYELLYSIGGTTKPLREWTGTEIIGHAEIELAKGATAVRNARFLRSVGYAAGAAKVGEAVSPGDLERMKADADASEV
ncbi:hypothetical protein NJB95_20570 [Brucella intermedia]|uniref:hypothetical protein n=1 Tax=Brucella intermedia TaxID=94625 RepID=UPI00209B95F2|nr:hypothetical protein [Brucella intermedia]MCO7738980.1 hypothetical protein [Brucella intermedia]